MTYVSVPAVDFDLVGFDLDGTLLDTHADLAAAVNYALRLDGRREIPSDEVRALVGGGAKKMLARAFALTGGPVPDDRFDELHARLLEFYENNIAVHSRLFPGGEGMLNALEDRGVKLAVVTNKLERLARKLLGELGLTDRFVTILGGDSLGPGKAKPRPDLLLEMMEQSGINAGRTAYVGDTTYDTGAASAAGVPCVVVSFGFNDGEPKALGGSAVIDHFDELIPALALIGPAMNARAAGGTAG